MEVRVLGYFIAVAEEGSFTRAAARCHIAQPSLSQQIRALERELGETLFQRLPRQTRMTPSGRALMPYARSALAAVEGARAEFARRAGDLSGELRLGLVDGIDTRQAAGMLASFSTDHPAVTVAITGGSSTELISGVSAGHLDAAVVAPPVRGLPAHLDALVLQREEIVAVDAAVGERTGLLSSRRQVAELAETKLITYGESSGVHPYVIGYLSEHGVTPRTVCAANDPKLHLALAEQGLGTALTALGPGHLDDDWRVMARRLDPPLQLSKVLTWPRQRQSAIVTALRERWERKLAASGSVDRSRGPGGDSSDQQE